MVALVPCRLRLCNVRTFVDASFPLDGLKVLIGENATGKSTVVEALQLLRCIGDGSFARALREVHGGLRGLLRDETGACTLALDLAPRDGADGVLRYSITFRPLDAVRFVVERESLTRADPGDASSWLLRREGSECWVRTAEASAPVRARTTPDLPALCTRDDTAWHDALVAAAQAIAGMRVGVGFDVLPTWVARALKRPSSPLRERAQTNAVDGLDLLGSNLAEAYFTFINEPAYKRLWPEILSTIQLGFGEQIEDVMTPAAGAGYVELVVQLRGRRNPVPAQALSNGMLAWLSLVALVYLGREARSMLVLDEPELHLHPRLLARAVQLFHATAARHPVLLATHSRRMLDLLGDEAGPATLVCTLDEAQHAAQVQTVNTERLRAWLEDFDGLGALADAGYLPALLDDPAPPGAQSAAEPAP